MKNKLPIWLLLVFLLVFLLRFPSFFDPYSYGDEGIYLTLGEAARQGLVFYRDIHDNKPPLLYLLATIAGSLFWFRFLLLVSNLATIYLFHRLAKTLLPKGGNSNKVATAIFAIFSSLPLLEGNIANAEIFMILPILAAIFLLLRQETPKLTTLFFAGILFSLASLFKIPAAFDFAAIVVFLLFFQGKKLITNYQLLVTSCLLLGFLLPILSTFFYYWTQGAFPQYLNAAYFQNLPYLSSWESGQASGGIFGSGVFRRGLFLAGAILLLWFSRKKWSQNYSLLFLWFLFALFGATLSGRPYPHYLIQILPPAVLFLPLIFTKEFWPRMIAFFLLFMLFFTTIYFKFWSYPTFSYYQNFLAFVLGQKSQDDYRRSFGGKVPQTYQLAQFLITHTTRQERIFIWGDSPVVYALSRRLPIGRYTAAYHIIDFKGPEETIQAIKKNKPRFIIDLTDEKHSFSELESLLAQNYFFFKQVDEAKIYHRLP